MADLIPNLDPLHELPEDSLRALAASLAGGQLSIGLTELALHPIVGAAAAARVQQALECLLYQGLGFPQIAVTIAALAGQKTHDRDSALQYSLVLSGPDVPGVPTADTAAVMQTLIEEAQHEALLVGYAVHNGKRLFAPLAARMEACPRLHVVMCVDIGRPYRDTSLASEIVARFAEEFRRHHWPWPHMPLFLYDPRAVEHDHEHRGSLHAKCLIVDRRAALITSANFTEAAQQRNIEAGVLVRFAPFAARLADYFSALQAAGYLARFSLP